eukprot:1161540-Pelagomonas_calceolata.AAC.27
MDLDELKDDLGIIQLAPRHHLPSHALTCQEADVRQWVAGCEAALAEQREMVEARELEVEAAAARLRAAEAELDFLADARQV